MHGELEPFNSTQIFIGSGMLQPQLFLRPQPRFERACTRLLKLQADEVYFPPIVRVMGCSTRHSLRREPRIAARRTCLFCPTDVARALRYIYPPVWSGGAHAVSVPLPLKKEYP